VRVPQLRQPYPPPCTTWSDVEWSLTARSQAQTNEAWLTSWLIVRGARGMLHQGRGACGWPSRDGQRCSTYPKRTISGCALLAPTPVELSTHTPKVPPKLWECFLRTETKLGLLCPSAKHLEGTADREQPGSWPAHSKATASTSKPKQSSSTNKRDA
jgi:hypothetical protein